MKSSLPLSVAAALALVAPAAASVEAAAAAQEARELLKSGVPAAWKNAAMVLDEAPDAPEIENLRVLSQLYGLGVDRDPEAAITKAQVLFQAGTASPEVLRHAGVAAALGLPDYKPSLRVGVPMIDAAAKAGDLEAAAIAGILRLRVESQAANGRARLEQLAEKHAGARAFLARALERGLGGPVDVPAAAAHLEALGVPDSNAALEKFALHRARDAEAIAHQASAQPWLRWAAATGSWAAAEKLGDMYRGLPEPTPGVPPDPARALAWYHRATLAGAPGVSAAISQIHLAYPETKRPQKEVEDDLIEWARARAGFGFPESLELLATGFQSGTRGVQADPAKARLAYEALVAVGHPEAAELLRGFESAQAMLSLTDKVELHESQIRAAISGDPRARYAVGLEFTRRPPEDEATLTATALARQWLEDACEGTSDPGGATLRAGACQRLGDILRREGGGMRQLERVRERYRRCAELGSVECAAMLARSYREEPLWKDGPTAPDLEQEKTWLAQAARGGDAAAKERLVEISTPPSILDELGPRAIYGAVALGGLLAVLAAWFARQDEKKKYAKYF